MTVTIGDIKRPLNVNDEDMWPDMPSYPIDHEGPTEMCFVLLRCSIGRYFRYLFRPVGSASQAGVEYQFVHPDKTMDELTKDFETYVQDNFLTNADPLVPIQFFTALVARAVICSWKVLNGLRKSAEVPNTMTKEGREFLFEEALKGIEYDNMGHTNRATQRFMWHIASHFQWHSLITLLHELRLRNGGDLIERAWKQIAETYENRPELMKIKNPLHAAIGRLTISAWRLREENYFRKHEVPIFVPEYINTLQTRLLEPNRDKSTPSSAISRDMGAMTDFFNLHPYTQTRSLSFSTNQQQQQQEPSSNINLNFFPPLDQTVSHTGLMNGESSTMTGFRPDLIDEDWFNTPFSPGAAAGLEPGQMDWTMWGSLLQDYELPMDGTDFVGVTPQQTGSFEGGRK